jgi:acyl CoA:acetate/3-ketoacid CoA transferase alpha subunit
MGCAKKLIFSWGGNPSVCSLHRFREAVERGWPHALKIEEHSHAGMANRYVAGASRLPFAMLRGYVGTDLPEATPTTKPVECQQAKEATGGDLKAAQKLDTTDPPTEEKLGILRDLRARTEASRGRAGSS